MEQLIDGGKYIVCEILITGKRTDKTSKTIEQDLQLPEIR